MLFGVLAGCKNNKITYADTSNMFTQEEIIVPGNYDFVQDSIYAGGKIYILATGSEMKIVPMPDVPEGVEGVVPAVPVPIVPLVEEPVVSGYVAGDEPQYASDGSILPAGMMEVYISKTFLLTMDEKGNKLGEKVLSSNGEDPNSNDYTSYDTLSLSPEGTVLMTRNFSSGSYDSSGNYNSVSEIKVVSIDENLNETDYFDVSAAMKNIPVSEDIDTNQSPYGFIFDNTGKAFMLTYQGVFTFEKASGKYLFGIKAQTEGAQASEYFGNLFNLNGQPAVLTQKWNNDPEKYEVTSMLKIVDVNTGKFGTEYPFDAAANLNPQQGNDDYPIIMVSAGKLYSFDWITNERTLLIDFLQSGVNYNGYGNVLILNADTFATVETSWDVVDGRANKSEPTTKMTIFRRVDPATVTERELIKIYTFYPDYELMQFAADYNKKSTEYVVDVKAYNEDYSGDTADIISKLNTDILSGNIPDIMVMNQAIPFDNYVSKGLFADLNKFLEGDTELTRDSMNESILNALSTDGKLYSLTKSYSITGLLGKKSIFGNDTKLTAEKMREVTAKYPDADLIGQTTRDQFINSMIENQINTYIDKETGEVSFNSPEFIELLNIAKTFPTEIDYENFDYSYYDNMYRNDKALLSTMYLPNFRQIQYSRYADFGEEVTFMGFPGATGTGIMIVPSAEISIMSGGNTDAAWEVVKDYMLLETDSYDYNFSIFNDKTDELAAAAKVPQTYTDYLTGEIIEQPNTYYVNDQEFTYPDNTDADNQVIFDIINNVEGVSRADFELMIIIEEETAAFFAGSKTAEECAKLIDDRASTYVAESR
jgi:ABC-type glycerol-3-phosphate transport system substrate-binding protein